MAPHPLDSPITSVILGGCDPPEVGFASLCSIACPRPVIRHAPHSSPNATSAQTTLPLNLPSLRHIAATETTRALFPSLLDVSALDERFSAQGHLTFGVDAIGARFVDNARESLYALPDAPLPVKEAMGAGWTIQLHQPQRFEDDLWRMMAAMEAEMGTLVGANAYLTPACAQGLAPHWDDVQVAVLQLYGEKTWSVWENRQRMNYSSGDLDRQRLGEPTATVVMRPGDVLLLPRGYVHQAVSLAGGESGHLTLSWGQGDSDTLGLVAKTVEAAMAQPPFHLELPDVLKVNVRMDGKDEDGAGGDGGEGGGEEGTGLAALLRALADHVETRPAVGRNGRNALAHDFMSSRLPPHPSQLPTEDELVPEEELTFQDDDVLELVGDFFCVLKDTPPTDIRLEVDAGRGVTVGFEGGEELRIMSSVDNHRESHMMSGAGGAGTSGVRTRRARGVTRTITRTITRIRVWTTTKKWKKKRIQRRIQTLRVRTGGR